MLVKNRIILLMILDSLIIVAAVALGYWIIHSHVFVASYVPNVIYMMTVAIVIFHHLYAMIFKLYYKVWEYASVGELITIFKVVTFTIATAAIMQLLFNDLILYKRMLIVTWMIYMIFLGGSRFIWRVFRDRYIRTDENKKRTLIVGAGNAGAMIARQLNSEQNLSELRPVAFVDDNEQKHHLQMFNIPVLGKVEDIPEIVHEHDIQHIVIAIPSLKNGQLQKIIDKCNETEATVKMLPRIEDLMTGKVSVSHLKNVEVEDLLGREPVELDIDAISDSITGEVILVTGAGGSIGSELCR